MSMTTTLVWANENTLIDPDIANQQRFFATLDISDTDQNTDVTCFNLSKVNNSNVLNLEYTTLGIHNGLLTMWSNEIIDKPLMLTLHNRCQHKKLALKINTDNTLITSEIDQIEATSKLSSEINPKPPLPLRPEKSSVQLNTLSLDETYARIEMQINALKSDYIELGTQLRSLKSLTISQASIIQTLKSELSRLQLENHFLRTLVLCFGLVLLGSGYFFADWLRQHSGKHKNHQISDRPSSAILHFSNSEQKIHASREQRNAQDASLSKQEGHDTESVFSADATQSLYFSSTYPRTISRIEQLPRQANDDENSLRHNNFSPVSQQFTDTVMQNASKLLTHGRTNQAIDQVRQHLSKYPKCSPWMWLFLLDLLAKENKHQEFGIVATECKKHFNVNIEASGQVKQQGLESFSRITQAIQNAWGTPQVIKLIDDLVYNNRMVPRMGFDRTVFEDLTLLREIACLTQNVSLTPPEVNISTDDPSQHLRELQQLSEDIFVMTPASNSTFQYWSDFTFELNEGTALRKSA